MSLPSINPTRPTAPASFNIKFVNDTIAFDWTAPVIKPIGMRYQILAAPFSLSDVSSKSVVWDGDALHANLRVTSNSALYYQVRAYAGSYYGPFSPNTYGIEPTGISLSAPGSFSAIGDSDRIYFSWSPPPDAPRGADYQLYQLSTSTPFSSATLVSQNAGAGVSLTRADANTTYFWIRTAFLGFVSSPSPGAVGLPSPAAIPSEPASLSIFQTSIFGTLTFDISKPVVMPLNTRYQIIRSSVSSDASAGAVVYDGNSLKGTIYAPSSTQYYYARAYAGSYYGPYYPNTTGLSQTGAPYTVNQSIVGSGSLSDKQIYNPCSITPDNNCKFDIHATVIGKATFDKDSGTYFSIVCMPTSYVDNSSGVPQINPTSATAAGGYQGGYWYFSSNSAAQTVAMRGYYQLDSGTNYTYGVQVFKAFGSLTFTDASISGEIVRY